MGTIKMKRPLMLSEMRAYLDLDVAVHRVQTLRKRFDAQATRRCVLRDGNNVYKHISLRDLRALRGEIFSSLMAFMLVRARRGKAGKGRRGFQHESRKESNPANGKA